MAIALDLKQLDMIADGYTEDFVEIYREFCKEIPPLLDDLGKAIAAGNANLTARTAHTIKGSISNFGMLTVNDLVKTIETQARGGDVTGLDAVYQQVLPAFDESVAEIKRERNI